MREAIQTSVPCLSLCCLIIESLYKNVYKCKSFAAALNLYLRLRDCEQRTTSPQSAELTRLFCTYIRI